MTGSTLPREKAHERFGRVAAMLRADSPVATIAEAEGLSLPATYNLIARTRRHFGAGLGDGDLRPAGSDHSPAKYERQPVAMEDPGA